MATGHEIDKGRNSMLLICASLGLIVLVTLWPFDFGGSASMLRSGRPVWLVGWGTSRVSDRVADNEADVLLNVVLFMPFGVGLARRLTSWRRLPGLMSLAVVFGACFAVSYAIEVLQQFLPARFPALRDVLANSCGGVLGWAGFHSYLRRRGPRGDASA